MQTQTDETEIVTRLVTRLHVYNFDTDKPEDRAAYAKLAAELKATPGRGRWMKAFSPPETQKARQELQEGEILIDAEYLFENQWNANVGRVFDWFEEASFSSYNGKEAKNIRRGHYIDITPAMVAIRQNTLKCGYTGQQFPASDFSDGKPLFNVTRQALGSPYLKENELHLLRLLPVCDCDEKRVELNDSERAFLLPLYVQAQTDPQALATAAEKAKAIADTKRAYVEAQEKFEKELKHATAKRDGKLWLLDHGINLDNCIYYDHTGVFEFGWRRPISPETEKVLRKMLEGFPAQFEIKTEARPS